MAAKPLDVRDVSTFDPGLIALLEAQADLVRDYLETDHKIILSHDLSRGPSRSILRPANPYASHFYEFREGIGREMEHRTIRAFHYTRLTGDEVAVLKRDGVHLSTPTTLRRRLDDIVKAGELPRDVADQLYAKSPFHSDQLRARSDKFWMASHPITVDNSGVEPLMKHWGGEVASMWIKDEALLAPLASIGAPRIIELAVPINTTTQSYSAGCAVVATFARSRGSIPEKHDFDLYPKEPLPPTAILAVHTEGEASFMDMGLHYPAGFVDVNIGYWNELTGEAD